MNRLNRPAKLGLSTLLSASLVIGAAPAAFASTPSPTVVNVDHKEMIFNWPEGGSTNVYQDKIGRSFLYKEVLKKESVTVNAIVTVDRIVSEDPYNPAGLDEFEKWQGDPQLQRKFTPTLRSKGSVLLRVDFVEAGTGNPVALSNFHATVADLDGASAEMKEYAEFGGFSSYSVDAGTGITVSSAEEGRTRFMGTGDNVDGIPFQDKTAVILNYDDPVQTLTFKIGRTATTQDARDFSIDFGAAGGKFTSPVVKMNPTVPNKAPTAAAQYAATDEDTDVGFTLSGSDDRTDPAALRYTVAALPAHGTLSGQGRNMIYTPDANYSGSDRFTFTVTDEEGAVSGEAAVTITVRPVNDPPQATEVSVTGTASVGQTLTGRYVFTDADGEAEAGTVFQWYRGTAANGSDRTPVSGAVSPTYRLTQADLGRHLFFGVTPAAGPDKGAEAVSAPTPVISSAQNSAPQAAPLTVSTEEDTSVSLTLSGTDDATPAAELVYAIVTPPSHGSLSGEAPHLVYRPNANYYGDDSLTYTVTDAAGAVSEEAAVRITVTSVDDAPVAANVTVNGVPAVGQTLTGSYTFTDVDGEAEAGTLIQWYRGTAPDGSDKTAIDGAQTLSYVLTESDKGSYIFFSVTPASGGQSGQAAVARTSTAVTPVLTGPNTPPSAGNLSVQLNEDTVTVIALSGTDKETPQALQYILTSEPAHGTLAASGRNVTYTPQSNYSGTDFFKYKVVDAGGLSSSEAAVTLTIREMNDPPSAIAPTVSTTIGKAVSITLNGSDVETPAAALTYKVTAPPAHGALSGQGRQWVYTPAQGYTGADSFRFTVSDGGGLTSAEAVVSISIAGTAGTPLYKDAENIAGAYDKQEDTAASIHGRNGYIIYSLHDLGLIPGDMIQYRMGTNTGDTNTVQVEYYQADMTLLAKKSFPVTGRNNCYYAAAPAGTAYLKISGVDQATLNLYEISKYVVKPPEATPEMSKDANNLEHAHDGVDTTSGNIFSAEGYIVYRLSDLGLAGATGIQYLLGTSTGHAYTATIEYLNAGFAVTGVSTLNLDGFKSVYRTEAPADAVYVRINGISLAALYIYEIGANSVVIPGGSGTDSLSRDANNLEHAHDGIDTTSGNIFTGDGYIVYALSDLGIPAGGKMQLLLGTSTGGSYEANVTFLDATFAGTGAAVLNISGFKSAYTAPVPAGSAYVRVSGLPSAALYIYELANGAGLPTGGSGLEWSKDANNLADAYDGRDTTSSNIFTADGYIIYGLPELGIQPGGSIRFLFGTSTGLEYPLSIDYLDGGRNVTGTVNMAVYGFKNEYRSSVPGQAAYIKLKGLSNAALYIYEIGGGHTGSGPIPAPSAGSSADANNLTHAHDGIDTTSANIFTETGYIVYTLSDAGAAPGGEVHFLLGTSTGLGYTTNVRYLDAGFNTVGMSSIPIDGFKNDYAGGTVPAGTVFVKVSGLPGAALYIYEIAPGAPGGGAPTVPVPVPGGASALFKDANNLQDGYDSRDTTSANIFSAEGYIIFRASDLGPCGCEPTGQATFLLGSSDGLAHTVTVDYLNDELQPYSSAEIPIEGAKAIYHAPYPVDASYIRIRGIPGAALYIYEVARH
ncbi:tandem-95 repeat protein [Gorillibacterium sp. sgz5001074]|uniref:tandem-95 repeat protein n=1 Tax=Gorillibacterium sp. sgz5001074 TaxID=3446695 RepID=UPI003F6768BE